MSVVEVRAGKLEGNESAFGHEWLGVPYAAPPLGPLRFRAPQSVEPWTGTRDARMFASPAMQTPLRPPVDDHASTPLGKLGTGSEDCLYVNIWSPDPQARLPVVVWFHGGGFLLGSGNIDNGRLAALEQGVVFVSVNYRLGPWGFLFLDDLAPGISDSNLALRDHVAVLEWVQDNIRAFGGDPTQVTISGLSSGGMQSANLLGAPSAAGLFQQAICFSGSAELVRDREGSTQLTLRYLDELGLDRSQAHLIPELPSSDLFQASKEIARQCLVDSAFDGEAFLPVAGDDFLPQFPLDSVRAGSSSAVILTEIWAKHEMNTFLIPDPKKGALKEELSARKRFGEDNWQIVCERYREFGPNWYEVMMTDFHFVLPAISLLEAQCDGGGRSRAIRLDRAPRTPPFDALGAVHGCDSVYLFGSSPKSNGRLDETDVAFGTKYREFCFGRTAFSESGFEFSDFDLTNRRIVRFDEDSESVKDLGAESRGFWDGIYEPYGGDGLKSRQKTK
ncbi:MAG TPA: carboxylesterase family protein [Galbitalea sp.]|nr:carboxylesterase family protein [Galbitalea sp.]